jgi:DNA-binding PadR family transcriptional regulator
LSNFYDDRRQGDRFRKPRDYNQLVDFDRLRILDKLRRSGDQSMLDLRNYVTESNGIRDARWDFYYIIRRMESDALLRAKYDPHKQETIVHITEYGNQRFETTLKALQEILE